MRRIVDILVALMALVLLSPVLVLIGLVVIIDSPGSPIYRGWRVGKGGRLFRIWKYRTMVNRAGAPITGRNDPRVTRLGGVLRRVKLDELPQFVNVLRGDMTLVGPRPEAPDMVARYTVRQRAVLRVRPGITGCVQLAWRSEESAIPEDVPADVYYIRHLMDRKLRHDLEYLDTRTPWSDARILFATAGVVLRSLVFK